MTAFLLAVAAIFLAAAALGALASRLRLPRVVGEMVAGLALGRSLLGHVWPRAESYLFGTSVVTILSQVGLLVVLFYLALVGAELDSRVVDGRSRRLAAAAVVGLGMAVGAAALLAWALSGLEPSGVAHWTYVAFLTGALLVTAVPVLARILDETGLTRTRVGGVTLTLSVVDDFLAFSIVAVAVAAATNGSVPLALAGTALLGSLVLARGTARGLRSRLRRMPAAGALSIGALALVAGAVNSLGASTLVAAFVVGALVWRPRSKADDVPGAYLIRTLVPLYIVYAALSVDVTRLVQPRLAIGIVLTTALAVGTKVVACLVAGRIVSLDRSETIGLAVLRNTRGLTELVALNLGYKAGLLSPDLYTVFFCMALVTTAASGAVAMRAVRSLEPAGRSARERAVAPELIAPGRPAA